MDILPAILSGGGFTRYFKWGLMAFYPLFTIHFTIHFTRALTYYLSNPNEPVAPEEFFLAVQTTFSSQQLL